jgi:Putative zinc-finger
MTDARCEQIRPLAAELALGVVNGEERARALEHLAGCPRCRQEVDRLASVADGLLLLAPNREVPIGFESRALERIRPERPRRWRQRALVPALAAATALLIGVAGALFVVDDDLELASRYRETLAVANGEYLSAEPLEAPGGVRAGTVFGYQGEPSWLFLTVEPPYRDAVGTAEVMTEDGARIPLPAFRLDDAAGSWGQAVPVDIWKMQTLRLRLAGGEALVARFGD